MFKDEYGMIKFPVFMAMFMFGLLALFAVLCLGGRAVSHHYDAISCASFSEATGRETKFVDYNYWAWGCLTPSSDGKWISVKALREVSVNN